MDADPILEDQLRRLAAFMQTLAEHQARLEARQERMQGVEERLQAGQERLQAGQERLLEFITEQREINARLERLIQAVFREHPNGDAGGAP